MPQPAPFLDPGLVVAHLQTALVPAHAHSVLEFGAIDRADPGQRSRHYPSVVVVAAQSANQPSGLHTYDTFTEVVSVLLQVAELRGDDADASAALRALRAALLAALHRQRIVPGWQPATYRGGRLLSIDDSVYTWAEDYALSRFI